MPGIDVTAQQQLLKHHFLAGLPIEINRQLQAIGEPGVELNKLVDRARLLMTIDEQLYTAAVKNETKRSETERSEMQKLQELVAVLKEQVAALTTESRWPKPFLQRCFTCNKLGYTYTKAPVADNMTFNVMRATV